MPMYQYRCPECRTTKNSMIRDNRLPQSCENCGHEPLHRVFGFSTPPMMHEHFNHSVGKPISSMRQYRDELARKSEEASEYTGIEHSYAPIEPGDAAAAGATNEGIDEANAVRSRTGQPLLPEVK